MYFDAEVEHVWMRMRFGGHYAKLPRLREHLPQQGRHRFVMTPRVPVADQPLNVRRLHRVGRALHGVPPAGEEIRRVPAHPAPGSPQQPERPRRHRRYRRVKVEGNKVVALDPRLNPTRNIDRLEITGRNGNIRTCHTSILARSDETGHPIGQIREKWPDRLAGT